MSSYTGIKSLIERSIESVDIEEDIQIAWPNSDYKPQKSQIYVRPSLFYRTPATVNIKGELRQRVELWLDVFVPIGEGEQELYSIIDQFFSFFHGKKKLQKSNAELYIRELGISNGPERDEDFFAGRLIINFKTTLEI